MIEIFVLVKFCKRLAEIAREKNRTGSWAALGAFGWVGGEITGAVVGAKSHGDTTSMYTTALLFAVIGAVLAYVIVRTLTPLPTDPNFPTARVV